MVSPLLVSPSLLSRVLGRERSLFAPAVEQSRAAIAGQLRGSRMLVIGAAGSIGAAMVRELQAWAPACLDLADTDENGLVDLVRAAHASGHALPAESTIAALDFTGPEFAALLRARPRYDFVLNFAALKHVRSESDPFTALRLLRINALAHRETVAALAAHPPRRYFVVSSDKAVRPANLLGASKALMERIGLAGNARVPFSSARFANVAFSRGSLLDGFLQRLGRGEPLSGPSDVRRFFISAPEAAQLCLLGCCVAPAGTIVVPAPDALPPRSFPEIASDVLASFGYTPRACHSAEEAVRAAQMRAADDRQWPCFFSPSDTSGEKDLEEFVGPDEDSRADHAPGVTLVHRPATAAPEALAATVGEIDRLLAAGSWTRPDLVRAVQLSVPEFHHRAADASLYQKL